LKERKNSEELSVVYARCNALVLYSPVWPSRSSLGEWALCVLDWAFKILRRHNSPVHWGRTVFLTGMMVLGIKVYSLVELIVLGVWVWLCVWFYVGMYIPLHTTLYLSINIFSVSKTGKVPENNLHIPNRFRYILIYNKTRRGEYEIIKIPSYCIGYIFTLLNQYSFFINYSIIIIIE